MIRKPGVAVAAAAVGLIGFAGPAQADDIDGTNGPDLLLGTPNNDTIRGFAADYVLGQQGADKVIGADGYDDVRGGDSADTVRGNDQGDDVYPGPGAGSAYGGSGNDDMYVTVDHKPDLIDCGDGDDTVHTGGSIDPLDAFPHCENFV